MKYLAMFGGAALIGAVMAMVGLPSIKAGQLYPIGIFINLLAVFTWVGIVNLLSDKK